MANFHSNMLVIAASDADMQKVLVRMAQNLAAHGEDTGFDISSIDGLRTAGDIFHAIEGAIEQYYWLSFTGAPIDRDVADAGGESWGGHAENEKYLASISAAFGALASLGDGVSVSFSLASTARPMSDTANVSCESCRDNRVLTIDYDTAWMANSDDIDLFFMGLPEGEYGVEFLDADEYDNYDTISVFCGLHHGRSGLRAAEVMRDDTIDKRDLVQEKGELSPVSRSLITDLAELANVVGVCGWNVWWIDDEDGDDEGDEGGFIRFQESGGDYERDPISSWGYYINWNNPSQSDLLSVDKAVMAVLSRFPWVVGSTGAAYEGRESNVERMLPGHPVKLVSDWTSPYFSPCEIQTRMAGDERLGNLDDRGGGMGLSDNARAALACILPHVRAYADKVEPLMTLDGRKRNSTLIVRLEIAEGPLKGIFDEVHALLAKPANERSVSSVVEGEE